MEATNSPDWPVFRHRHLAETTAAIWNKDNERNGVGTRWEPGASDDEKYPWTLTRLDGT